LRTFGVLARMMKCTTHFEVEASLGLWNDVRHRHLHRELHRHSIQREALPDLVETQSSAASLLPLRAAEAS
jgi:hypothetical protein